MEHEHAAIEHSPIMAVQGSAVTQLTKAAYIEGILPTSLLHASSIVKMLRKYGPYPESSRLATPLLGLGMIVGVLSPCDGHLSAS